VIGTALRIAATVEQGRRRLDLARQSVEVLTRSEARLELALALRLLGETEWRMGRLEDARTHLSPALDLASVCGAHPLRRDVAAALRRAGREVPDEPVLGPASLTPREATVADLAAGGRSAREIAEVVYLTVDAVERHLGAVYRKLGVHTRAELSGALRS
jgi:DNA-binding CsgD family transcriptional regulator